MSELNPFSKLVSLKYIDKYRKMTTEGLLIEIRLDLKTDLFENPEANGLIELAIKFVAISDEKHLADIPTGELEELLQKTAAVDKSVTSLMGGEQSSVTTAAWMLNFAAENLGAAIIMELHRRKTGEEMSEKEARERYRHMKQSISPFVE